MRPAEVDALQANPEKARKQLGWSHQLGFEGLVQLMVEAELADIDQRRSGLVQPVAELVTV